jgi:putative transposase
MTYQDDLPLPTELLEQLTEKELESLPEMIRVLVNEVMRLEIQNHLRAKLYERTEGCRWYANGYKLKRVKTLVGEINFDIPQVREGCFYAGALEKGMRSERALMRALAEIYVKGVSTRKVATITEKLNSIIVPSTHISLAAYRK